MTALKKISIVGQTGLLRNIIAKLQVSKAPNAPPAKKQEKKAPPPKDDEEETSVEVPKNSELLTTTNTKVQRIKDEKQMKARDCRLYFTIILDVKVELFYAH